MPVRDRQNIVVLPPIDQSTFFQRRMGQEGGNRGGKAEEIGKKEFEREEDLLNSLDKDKIIIYFSTCSIYDPTVQNSSYVRHKMVVETIIKYKFKKSIIFRLPIVIGNTKNKNTFFGYFIDKINNESDINVDLLSSRYLIDSDDLSFVLSKIIEQYRNNDEIGQKKINVGFDNKMMVTDIINMMMGILNKKSKINLICSGCDYEYNKKYFDDYIKSIDYKIPENYTYNILKKYLI